MAVHAESNGDLRERLRDLEVDGVEDTQRELGRGAYGVVIELKVNGLRCAGKKLHDLFFARTTSREWSQISARFVEECLTHSKLMHPNIVQFIGVHFKPGDQLPTVILELMALSLSQALERYPSMPSFVENGILLDVSFGLLFLHSQVPPIIHRDLTANNILLTESFKAKIADLGVARIVSVNPAQISAHLTTAPGNPSYMPPEAFVARPVYNTKLDVFSFGNLILHTLVREWPIPVSEMHQPLPDHPGMFTPVTEVQRRVAYFNQIDDQHPLKSLAILCLQNDPRQRPTTAEIAKELEHVVSNDPQPFSNALEMYQELERKREEIESLQQLTSQLQKSVIGVDETDFEIQAKFASFSEAEALSEQVSALSEDNSALSSLVEAKTSSLAVKEQQIEVLKRELVVKEEQLKLSDQERKTTRKQLNSAIKQARASTAEAQSLRRDMEEMLEDLDILQHQLATLNESAQAKEEEIALQRERVSTVEEEVRVKVEEITAKDALLQSKEKLVCSLGKQVKSLKCANPNQVTALSPGASLEWKPCADLPAGILNVQAVQLNNKVYVHGDTNSASADNKIFTYDIPKDNWVDVINCPTKWSALVSYRSELVLIGGQKRATGKITNQLWVLQDEFSLQQSIQSMPTARHSPAAVGHGDYLVVAGGSKDVRGSVSCIVEIYDAQKWILAEPLPLACRDMKSTCLGDLWYLVGGVGQRRSIFCASLCSLVGKANGEEIQQSTWKSLPDVPNLYCSVAVFGEALLVMGGMAESHSSSIYMYVPLSHSWVYIGELWSEAASYSSTLSLACGDILHIGGDTKSGRSQQVFKAQLKDKQ